MVRKNKLKKEWIRRCKDKTLFCYLCGKLILREDEISIDHVIPKSQGGPNTRENMKPAHILCNNIRGTMEVDAFRAILKTVYNNNIYLWWKDIHQHHIHKRRR